MKDFRIQKFRSKPWLYVQSDTLLLALFKSFKNKYFEMYVLNPVWFPSVPGLVLQICLKKTKFELKMLTDNDMVKCKKKGIKGGMCHAIHKHTKANNKQI